MNVCRESSPSPGRAPEPLTATMRLILAVRALIEPHGPVDAREREEEARERAAAAPCPDASPWTPPAGYTPPLVKPRSPCPPCLILG